MRLFEHKVVITKSVLRADEFNTELTEKLRQGYHVTSGPAIVRGHSDSGHQLFAVVTRSTELPDFEPVTM